MAAERGATSIELLVAAAIGTLLAGAALALCAAGNRAVAALGAHQTEWQHARAAAALWAAEWRGSGYDPSGGSGAGVTRLAPDTMEFSSDWNGDGALLPTGSNPNERLSWAAPPDSWRRGVNGGPRLAIAWMEGPRFEYLDAAGAPLPERPPPGAARVATARTRLRGLGEGAWIPIAFRAARRNPP
ncbi:MAG TPA: hypothetical protein VM778_05495 [Gemmatimonadota bacterium]|nr:hypothetical protein [Gemmatimonadota bacterium]